MRLTLLNGALDLRSPLALKFKKKKKKGLFILQKHFSLLFKRFYSTHSILYEIGRLTNPATKVLRITKLVTMHTHSYKRIRQHYGP